MDPEVARHRALGEGTRVALLGVLEGSSEPLDAHVLADRLVLHVNTVRWHLGVLMDAGLVVEERAGSGAPGRPRHGYRLAENLSNESRYGMLAEILVDALAHREPDSAGTLEAAGRARGRMLVRSPLGGGSVDADEAIASIVELLQGFGFQARHEHSKDGDRITMRPCPFGEMAASHSSIVCPVNLGLMRGALDTLDAPVEAISLEPFVEPDLCVARLHVTSSEPGAVEAATHDD
jgi:predicted ArsR family transcriptional regulator